MSAKSMVGRTQVDREAMRFFYGGKEVNRAEFTRLARWYGKGRVVASRTNGVTVCRIGS